MDYLIQMEISALIDDIINYLITRGRQFPCKCSNTLNTIASTMKKPSLLTTKTTQAMKNKKTASTSNSSSSKRRIVTIDIPTFSNDPKNRGLKVGDNVMIIIDNVNVNAVIVRIFRHILSSGGGNVGDEFAKFLFPENKKIYRKVEDIY